MVDCMSRNFRDPCNTNMFLINGYIYLSRMVHPMKFTNIGLTYARPNNPWNYQNTVVQHPYNDEH